MKRQIILALCSTSLADHARSRLHATHIVAIVAVERHSLARLFVSPAQSRTPTDAQRLPFARKHARKNAAIYREAGGKIA